MSTFQEVVLFPHGLPGSHDGIDIQFLPFSPLSLSEKWNPDPSYSLIFVAIKDQGGDFAYGW